MAERVPGPRGLGSVGLMALGQTIKRLRIERDIGPRGLAFDAEISEETLASVEGGQTEPRWGTLRRIARALRVELPVILAEVEELEDEMRSGGVCRGIEPCRWVAVPPLADLRRRGSGALDRSPRIRASSSAGGRHSCVRRASSPATALRLR